MAYRLPSAFSSAAAFANAPWVVRRTAASHSHCFKHGGAAASRRGYASQAQEGTRSGAKYDVTGTTLVLTLIPVLTFGLGVWQIKRLNWKINLMTELDEKLAKDPIQLPSRVDTNVIPEFAYRKVEVTGHFDHSKEVLLGPRTRESVLGYQLVTPLIRDDNDPESTIMVNRGHVSMTKKDPATRPESLTEGTQHVVGMLRDQEARNMFTPVNKPASGEFQFADIGEMATATGSQPVLVDQIFEGNAGEMKSMLQHGIPLGRAPTIELRNQHATYAVTWFALSAATSVMLWRLFRRPPAKTARITRFES